MSRPQNYSAIHLCEWRNVLDLGHVPPTHVAREKLLRDGYDDVIYSSFMSPGGT